MQFESIWPDWKAAPLTEEDIPLIYRLCASNPQYYRYCPPAPTAEGIREDLTALPPGVEPSCKYFVGLRQDGVLAAVLDLILGYPKRETVWIGFFMMEKTLQGQGNGSRMIDEACGFFSEQGYERVELAYAKVNEQSSHFWRKNQFLETGRQVSCDGFTAVVMGKWLEKKSS